MNHVNRFSVPTLVAIALGLAGRRRHNHWGDGTQIEPAAENPAAAASIDNPKGEVMHNGRMVEVEHIGEYQSYSPQPEDFYMVQTAEWAKGFALRKAEELIEWTKTHGLKREL